jgi:transcription initiation factor TFIIB
MTVNSKQVRTEQDHNHTNDPDQDSPPGVETDISSEDQCPDCGGRVLTDSGERHCSECGLVVTEQEIDHGPEWRSTPSDDDSRSRVGAPLRESHHDRGLSTEIGSGNRDAYGNTLSQKQREKMRRLRKWDRRFKTRNSKDRNLRKGIAEISRMKSALGLPDSTEETASMIFRRVMQNDLLNGRCIEGMAGAALYIAAKIERVPQTYSDLECVSRVGIDQVKTAEMTLLRELELGVAPTMPEEYIPRFAERLNLPQEHIRTAEELIEGIKGTTDISGEQPSSLAASALFAAGVYLGRVITQKQVAEECDVSEPTIRKQYRLLLIHAPDTEYNSMGDFDTKRAINVIRDLNGQNYTHLSPE